MILEGVRAILESLDRHGLHGARGIRRENSCYRDMRSYFRLLKEKLPIDRLAELAQITTEKKIALHTAEILIQRALRQAQPALIEVLASQMMLGYKDGWKAAKVLPKKIKEADQLGDTGQRAADYAAAAAGELVKDLNQTTLDTLQELVADAIENQQGVEGLAKTLSEEMDGMSRDRARMIARTEMNKAFSSATLDKLSSLQIEYKQWISYSDCCDDCSANDDDGPIPVDQLFSSGDEGPPAHPNCRCALAGAASPDSEEEE
jgi:SPP1 gp7 family putative phage head morphogenesis protein